MKQATVIKYEHDKEKSTWNIYFINGKEKIWFGEYMTFELANRAVVNRKKVQF